MSRIPCPMCRRMLHKVQLSHRIGQKAFYPDFCNYHGIYSAEYSPDQKICGKCVMKVRHRFRVKDENNKRKFRKSTPLETSLELQQVPGRFNCNPSCHGGLEGEDDNSRFQNDDHSKSEAVVVVTDPKF